MAASPSFFENDTSHGFVKRFIFKRHCEAFIAKTQQASNKYQAIICDVFAGAGCYADSPIEIKNYGSPLIALYVVIRFYIRKNKIEYTFRSWVPITNFKGRIKHIKTDIQMPESEKDVILNFSEADKGNCLKLVNNIIKIMTYYDVKCSIPPNSDGVITIDSKDQEFPFCINIACTEFIHLKPPDDKPNRRLLAFIDPFGYSQIPMHHLQRFIGERREAFINFMSSYINRFKNQEQNEDAICSLFGFSDEEKSKRLLKLRFGSNEEDGINRCLQMYQKELKKRAESDLILTFAIRNKRNVRLYHLTFITNHIKGFEAMKEAMNSGSQGPDYLSVSDYMVEKNGMQLSLVNDQNNEEVAEGIFQTFHGQKRVQISEIKKFILLETPFVWRKKALKILQKEPKDNPRLTAVADEHGKPPERKGSFPDGTEWRLTFRTQSVFDRLVENFQNCLICPEDEPDCDPVGDPEDYPVDDPDYDPVGDPEDREESLE